MNIRIIRLERKADPRGWLLKVLMKEQIEGSREFGEIYLSVSHPKETRGNHYHQGTTEWFTLLSGRGVLHLQDPRTGERKDLPLDAQEPQTVVVPPGVAHSIENTGAEPLYLLAYADVPYDPGNPDTVPFRI